MQGVLELVANVSDLLEVEMGQSAGRTVLATLGDGMVTEAVSANLLINKLRVRYRI